MNKKVVQIALYLKGGTHSIESAINQVEQDVLGIEIVYPEIQDAGSFEIIIVEENNLDSPVMKVVSELDKTKNIILIVPENDAYFVSTLIKSGFSNFFVFPFEYYRFIDHLTDLLYVLSIKPDTGITAKTGSFEEIIGSSKDLLRIIELSKKIADKRNVNVLISGETGTGKGMLAKAIHNFNMNPNPFVEITCTAIPESLLESELFGYEPGAFTNAKILKHGLFELAEGGTLFLDEIAELNINIQSKLLRTIEKKIIRRLGGVQDVPISARIISASNKNLEQQIENNSFRRDLYHRLNTVSIELPPLRHRGNDLTILLNFFLNHFNKVYNKRVRKIDNDFKEYIYKYSWPGNIRELRNTIERSVLLSEDNTLTMKHFNEIGISYKDHEFIKQIHPSYINLNIEYEKIDLKMIEKIYAKEALNKLKGNKSKTAKLLGISRPKLDDLLRN